MPWTTRGKAALSKAWRKCELPRGSQDGEGVRPVGASQRCETKNMKRSSQNWELCIGGFTFWRER